MRAAALAFLVLLALSGAGCSLKPDDGLRRTVEEALLPGMDRNACEWGSSSFETEPRKWYGCWDYVAGNAGSVSEQVSTQLAEKGFDVTEKRSRSSVELTAVRAAETVCVDVLERGFERGRNTVASEVDLADGEVFVDVWTAEQRGSQANRCAGLPGWDGEEPASAESSDASASHALPAAVPWKKKMSNACSDLGAALVRLDPPADRNDLEHYLRRVLAYELAFDQRVARFRPAPQDTPEAKHAAALRRQWERALARLALASAAGKNDAALDAAADAQALARKANGSLGVLGLTQCLLPETGIPG